MEKIYTGISEDDHKMIADIFTEIAIQGRHFSRVSSVAWGYDSQIQRAISSFYSNDDFYKLLSSMLRNRFIEEGHDIIKNPYHCIHSLYDGTLKTPKLPKINYIGL